MIYTDAPESLTSDTPQSVHREAALQLERAAEYHRKAASLHEVGDVKQADIQASIAHVSAARAMADSARAMKMTLW
jgi:hypothetical protein